MTGECKTSFQKFIDKKDEIKTKETEIETIRGETQQVRFEVEELMSKLKN